MNTELTTLKDLSFDQIAALTGAVQTNTNILPNLQVNREPEDDEGQKLPMGYFMVSQDNNKVFSKTAQFRPFINAYQYVEWSNVEKKYINRSLIIKNFNEEALDTKGGVSCGKVPFKKLSTLSTEEQLKQKDLKCRRHIYGLVTFTEEIESLPVLWKLSGSNFMAPDVALKSITHSKHQYFQHVLDLSTERKKVGSTIFYNVNVSVDLKNELKFSDDDFEIFKMFQENIDRENAYVHKLWREVKTNSKYDNGYLKDLDLNDPVDDL